MKQAIKSIIATSGLVLAAAGLTNLPISAQTSYGSIVGTVTDASGANVPDAVVTLTNAGTSERRAAATDSNGNYQFVNLVPGMYKLDIEKSGFKRLSRDHIQVVVQSGVRVDAAMQVGDVGQTMDVVGEVPLLQTENASLGQVVEGRTVTELPLNGRNVYNLIALAPGVVPQGGALGTGSLFAFGNYQISGGIPSQGKSIIDGAPLNTGYINSLALVPIQDMVQEFQVQSNNLSPEFGGTLNGVVNLASKSGTNQFHGAAYEFLRNRVLNSNTFFSNRAGLARPAFTQNQWGANVGGRLIKDKTFFFVAYEGFRRRQGTTGTYTVPTAQQRAGDFSNTRNSKGDLIPVYDPLTTCGVLGNPVCESGQTIRRSPFPGNAIPQSRFDKTASIMEKYWPLPNQPGTPFTNTNNYTVNYAANAMNRDEVNARIDENISDKQRLFGRFTRWAQVLPGADPYNLGIFNTPTYNTKQVVLADTYTFNPNTILDVHAAYLRSNYIRLPNTLGIDLTATIGWPAATNSQFLQRQLPGLLVQGFSNSDVPAVIVSEYSDIGSTSGSLTHIWGRHTIKAGGELAYYPTNFTQFGGGSNRFSFTTNFTAANPLSPGTTGSGFASYLLGLGSSGSMTNINFPATMQKAAGAYVGDTFQVNNKLTLNYGVRWDFTGYWTERHDLETVFLPGATNPVLQSAGLKYGGDVVLVNSPRYPDRHNLLPHWDLFAPRLGAAYRLDDRTVIRTGFGIQYTPGATVQNASPYAAPINTATTPWVPTLDGGITPVATLSNPFPNGVLQPAGRTAAYESSILGTHVVMPIPGDATPYVMNWNIDVQRQIAGVLLEAGYVGLRGVHLRMGGGGVVDGLGFNEIPAQYLSMGSQLLTPVANPFYGIVPTGPLAGRTIPAGQLLLPYPQYTGVNSPSQAAFDNSYNSLQAKAQKRFGSGGTILVAYTWAKSIGNSDTATGFLEAYSPGISQNFYNLKADRSLLTFDVPQRLSVSYVVDLPFGKGKRFLAGAKGVPGKLVSGWGINGVTTLQTGFPIPMLAAATALSTNFNSGSPRPNVTSGCDTRLSGPAQQRLTKWFNTSCFSAAPAFGFGTESRTDPHIRTHGVNNFDFTIFKNTQISERFGLQFRTEVFNLFNRVQFGVPGNTQGSALFGLISKQLNDPRLIQMALRLSF